MTQYDELDVPRPRSEELAAKVVRRLDPWWGWVAAGALLALAGGVVGSLALMVLMPLLGVAEATPVAQVLAVVALGLAESAAFIVFTRWRRARIARKRALVRDGVLTTATVVERSRKLDKGRTDLTLVVSSGPSLRCLFNVWFGPAPGRDIRVLWLRGSATLLAFDTAGRAYSGHVKRVRLG